MNFLRFLEQKNIINKETTSQLETQMKQSGKRLEELLLERKIVSEQVLFELKSEVFKVPLRAIDPEGMPLKVLQLIPEDSAKYYTMIPMTQKGNVVEIGMVYPEDFNTQEALKFLSRRGNFSYQVFLITPSTFEKLMKQYRVLKGEMKRALEELEKALQEEKPERKKGKIGELMRVIEEAPITKLVAVILRNAVEGRASDVHIEPTSDSVRVRFRFLGALYPSLMLPLKVHLAIVAHIKILCNMRIDETRMPQDGRFSTVVEGRSVDFRVSTFPTALGEKVAIRVLDPSAGLKEFEDLGLEGSNITKVKEAVKKPYGLILVTGPTGSGKTTTLYTILHAINREDVNIVSLEDPVEYFIEGVNQSQMRPEIGYDFAQGLRQVLRQDPDVIMVGEVRDKDTAQLVIHAALTGHIVVSTLHTNNALGVIPRLVDMGVDRFLIPSTLSIAVAQRLVRRLCDACKEKIKPTKAIQDLIVKAFQEASLDLKKRVASYLDSKEPMVFKPTGCKKCGETGFTGRIAVFEVLLMTIELADIILRELSELTIEQEAKRQGMITMRQDGLVKVLDGVTSIEEVLRETRG